MPLEPIVLSGNWSRIRLAVPKRVWPPHTSFNLQFRVAKGVFPAGSVWIDDVSIHNLSSNATSLEEHWRVG